MAASGKLRRIAVAMLRYGGVLVLVLISAAWASSGRWQFSIQLSSFVRPVADDNFDGLCCNNAQENYAKIFLAGGAAFWVQYGRLVPAWNGEGLVRTEWTIEAHDQSLIWWPPAVVKTAGGFVVLLLWPFWCLAAVTTGASWRGPLRYAARRRRGACVPCGYDRRGLPAGEKCPECGGAGTITGG